MNIINRSFFFFLITILALSFFVNSQSNAETTFTFINEGGKISDNTLQTKKALERGTPRPRGPQVPESPQVPQSPQSPESPDGGYWDTRLIGPQGPIER